MSILIRTWDTGSPVKQGRVREIEDAEENEYSEDENEDDEEENEDDEDYDDDYENENDISSTNYLQKNDDIDSNANGANTYEQMFESLGGVNTSLDYDSLAAGDDEENDEESEQYGDDILKLIEQYDNDMGNSSGKAASNDKFRRQYYEQNEEDDEVDENESEDDAPVNPGYIEAKKKTKKKEYVTLNNSSVKSSGYGPSKPNKAKKAMKQKYDKLKAIQQQIIDNRDLQTMIMRSQVGNADYTEEDYYPEELAVKRSSKNANSKHKQWLEEVAEKRRMEEEELQRHVETSLLKRKKFKEALLEKALKAREEAAKFEADFRNELTGEVLPTFLIPTKAFKVQQAPKKLVAPELSAEEIASIEAEKLEQVTKIRRKFKEQHKLLLQQLKLKNEKQKADDVAASIKKMYKPVLSKIHPETKVSDDIDIGRVSEQMVDNCNIAAAGSGLSAVRSSSQRSDRNAEEDDIAHSLERKARKLEKKKAKLEKKLLEEMSKGISEGNSDVELTKMPCPPDFPKKHKSVERRIKINKEDESSVDASDEPKEIRKTRASNKIAEEPLLSTVVEGNDAPVKNVSNLLNQTKLSEYLKEIGEARKIEELEKIKKEERIKKRMQLLSQRLLKEGAERKLMQAEDTWKFIIQTGNNNEKPKKKYRKPIPRAEENENAVTATESVEGEKKPPKARVFKEKKKVQESSSSSDDSTSEDDDSDSAKRLKKRNASPKKKFVNAESTLASAAYAAGYVARDFVDWKRKNNVPQDSKVFCMTGWYPCVKQALLDRGWYFNSDPDSPFADLKWTLRSVDVNQESLLPWQLTNHFMKNMAITTKAGLIKSLSSLGWAADVGANDIIPRGYDLSTPSFMRAFIDDFRCQQAEILLRRLYKKVCGFDNPVMSDCYVGNSPGKPPSTPPASGRPQTAGCSTWTPVPPPAPTLVSPNDLMVNKAVFGACCNVLEKLLKLHDPDDAYLDDLSTYYNVNNNGSSLVNNGVPGSYNSFTNNNGYPEAVVTPLEWELIEKYDLFSSNTPLPVNAPEAIDGFLQAETEKEFMKEHMSNLKTAQQHQQYQQKEAKRMQKCEQAARDICSDSVLDMVAVTDKGFLRVHNLLSKARHYLHKAQANLSGTSVEESKNMWIVKPAAKSRGRGIMTFGDLSKLLRYVEAGNGLSTQWIVQKYMENAMIIAKRKFDLRQWVLVTDWNPLTIYFYHECYARFSVEEYSTAANDLENAYVHLVNNSIGKNSDKFGQSFTTENGEVIEGYMMNYTSLVNYFKFMASGKDVMREVVTPRLKDIAKWSLMCASEMVEHRKNSWELYGFDFMIDTDYNAWLIEINSSPACDYSTKTTETYVQAALVELLSVVLDTREYENTNKRDRDSKGMKKPDTGGWECIYKGPLLEKPVSSIGADIIVTGNAIKLPKRNVSADYSMPSIPPNIRTMSMKNDSIHAAKQINAGDSGDNVKNTATASTKGYSTKSYKLRKQEDSNAHTNASNIAMMSITDELDDDDVAMKAPNTFNDSDGESAVVEGRDKLSNSLKVIGKTGPLETTVMQNSNVGSTGPGLVKSNSNSNIKSANNNKGITTKGQAVAPIAIKTFTMEF